jgi:hypothetical protein
VAARSKKLFCGHLLTGISGSVFSGEMSICVL